MASNQFLWVTLTLSLLGYPPPLNPMFDVQTCAICFLMSKAFQKAKIFFNLKSGSGSKQRFSLLQEKAVIQAVCLRTQAVSIKARF